MNLVKAKPGKAVKKVPDTPIEKARELQKTLLAESAVAQKYKVGLRDPLNS